MSAMISRHLREGSQSLEKAPKCQYKEWDIYTIKYPFDLPFSIDWLKSHFRDVSCLPTLTKIAFTASAKHSSIFLVGTLVNSFLNYKILETRSALTMAVSI